MHDWSFVVLLIICWSFVDRLWAWWFNKWRLAIRDGIIVECWLQVARTLGLEEASKLPKRAIQFGTRIAKLSNVREFGSNRRANMQSAGEVNYQKGREIWCDSYASIVLSDSFDGIISS
jgi:hypothetical protein